MEVIQSYREKGYELDIYIPSKQIGVEYDGYYWHRTKSKKDLEKNRKCEKDGIQLYRIRENLPSLNDSSIDYVFQVDFEEILECFLTEIINIDSKLDIDLKRDYIAIENLREYNEKKNSLLSSNPKVAIEWNYEKNCKLKPENFTSHSNKKVWWRCNKGHEWQAVISSRFIGSGCPFCSGKKAVKGYNDLQTVNPVLAKEWNYEKNDGITPTDVMPNSGKKVWWRCINGHEWDAVIGSRNKGHGCPYCSGRRKIKEP